MGTIRARQNFVAVGAAALLLAPAGAADAEAQELACGTIVVENVTLERDLTDCPPGTNGLTIGADNIIVILNGHKISGRPGSANGIDNSGGYDNVKITGGTINGFTNGVEMRGASGTLLTGLTIRDNADVGLHLLNSQRGRFSDLEVLNNGGDGAVFADGGGRNDIQRTSFANNEAAGIVIAGDGNTLIQNSADDNAADGFVVQAGRDIKLTENQAARNGGSGITIESAGTVAKKNTANANKKFGIHAASGTVDAGGNQARGNTADAQCTAIMCT